jgi:amino acid adenylation domain-containing protein
MPSENAIDGETQWLGDGFLNSLKRVPDRPALEVGGEVLTYRQLAARASQLHKALGGPQGEPTKLTALFSTRSASTYAGILAILFRGHGYVPLSPKFPTDRLAFMLENADCSAMIVDSGCERGLDALLDTSGSSLKVVMADRADVAEIAARHPRHHIVAGRKAVAADHDLTRPPDVGANDLCYLLFTSGSTGRPKGVMNTHTNVAHFLNAMLARFEFTEKDRFSQMFELSFDPSVFDIFVAWALGASLVCPQPAEIMLPADFIRRSALTVWSSVPSIAVVLNRIGHLEKNSFPSLRYSFFCGEALLTAPANAWLKAASGSVLENLYGPTECTVYCTGYRLDGTEDPFGSVPMGRTFPGLRARVVDPDFADVAEGGEGELLISGPQVALGYWKDAEKTAKAFVLDDRTGERFYRTGDLVRLSERADGPMTYLGRIDNQIKLHGQRVELGEVEAVLREASNASQVVVVGWPVTLQGIGGLAAFFEADHDVSDKALEAARRKLPPYMVPRIAETLSAFPLNASGKVDRKALITRLETSS